MSVKCQLTVDRLGQFLGTCSAQPGEVHGGRITGRSGAAGSGRNGHSSQHTAEHVSSGTQANFTLAGSGTGTGRSLALTARSSARAEKFSQKAADLGSVLLQLSCYHHLS